MQTENKVLPPSIRLSESTVYALQKDIYALDLRLLTSHRFE